MLGGLIGKVNVEAAGIEPASSTEHRTATTSLVTKKFRIEDCLVTGSSFLAFPLVRA